MSTGNNDLDANSANDPQDRSALLKRIGVASEKPAQDTPKRPVVGILLGVLILQSAFVGYLIWVGPGQFFGQANTEKSDPVVQDNAANADQATNAAAKLVAQGYIVAQRQATVSSRQLGVIEAIYVDEGDFVTKGQVLGQLDRRDANLVLRAFQADLRVLKSATRGVRAQLERERNEMARRSEIFDRGFLSKTDMEVAQTQFAVAEANLQSALSREQNLAEQIARARLQISDLSIRAPFSGIVIERNAQPGEVLAPSGAGGGFTRTGLCTIVDMNSRQIVVDVSEQMITRVTKGQAVEAELSAYPDLAVSGRVAQITPSADRGRGTVRVRIELLTQDMRILPDMAVKVRFL